MREHWARIHRAGGTGEPDQIGSKTGAAVVAHPLCMPEVDDSLSVVLPRLQAAELALHRGDAGPRQSVRARKWEVAPRSRVPV